MPRRIESLQKARSLARDLSRDQFFAGLRDLVEVAITGNIELRVEVGDASQGWLLLKEETRRRWRRRKGH